MAAWGRRRAEAVWPRRHRPLPQTPQLGVVAAQGLVWEHPRRVGLVRIRKRKEGTYVRRA